MVDPKSIQMVLHSALEGRLLLAHPFYQRWEAGELDQEELAHYAEQYRYVEAQLPPSLSTIASSLPAGTVRSLVEQNLADELGTPMAHVELFESFAEAVKARTGAPMTSATKDLVDLYRDSAQESAITGLGVLAAYEVQAATIAESKASGLKAHYDLDASGTSFWDVHATLELEHSSWSIEALADLDADLEILSNAVSSSADAWWAFLDERELENSAKAN